MLDKTNLKFMRFVRGCYRGIRYYFLMFVTVYFVMHAILNFCVVPTGSMLPTFQIGETILAECISPKLGHIERGDIIIFYHGADLYVKRVIGLPGEQVHLRDGRVYINDCLLDESEYLEPDVMTYPDPVHIDPNDPTFAEYQVPADSVMVMGDNRGDSYDARFWNPQERFVRIKSIQSVCLFHFYNPFLHQVLMR